ncbi:SnoaL-like protein [Microcella alkaliphila]|uniref:SnoaL-like protein n=1 Tax=Microcella alkaliphila TaxID=279828 RepID=A0A4Q7TT60_9MICO|nr:nuclear transport factor 2 family protein [Microcella alkaliphila]RZT64184.1 SnoaL-like protein [Microcella alkaliphila]
MSTTTATAPLTHAEVTAAAARIVDAFARTDTDAYFAEFDAAATFVFHPEAARLDDRAAYETLWASWLADGWRVVSCASSDPLVQLLGNTAIFTHTVTTTAGVPGDDATTLERETIVFQRQTDGSVLAVHEHLSTAPTT